MMRFVTLLVFLICLPACASAKIYKLAIPTDQGFSLYWWPVLPEISGWHHDEAVSEHLAANTLLPNGQSFNAAPAIIYAKADYKPRMADIKTLTQFIAGDIASFRHDVPDEQISLLEHFPILLNRIGFPNRFFCDSRCTLAKEAGVHGQSDFG
jgi:hypothetical protein